MHIAARLAYYSRWSGRHLRKLLDLSLTYDDVWSDPRSVLKSIGWSSKRIADFTNWQHQFDVDHAQAVLSKHGISITTQDDASYPALLKDIYDPPGCLFVRGTLPENEPWIAVVGSRKYSMYGKQVCTTFCKEMARAGVVIVSGLALGIDGMAHAATLKSGTPTIAVLGGGIDPATIYPAKHFQLSQNILDRGGALISEYPPGTRPTRYTFPERNRIIAGITHGCVVIEAGATSGARITAQFALDANRHVWAVPHNITSATGAGSNALLQAGAYPTTSANDILEFLDIDKPKKANAPTLSEDEKQIITLLAHGDMHIDDMCMKLEMPASAISNVLMGLEIKGCVFQSTPMTYNTIQEPDAG
jgi:DNA processing protein